MTEATDKAALELIMRTMPTQRGVVLLVTPDGQVESAALNMSDSEVMLACWSVAVQIAAESPEGISIFQRLLNDAVHKNDQPKPRLYVANGPLK